MRRASSWPLPLSWAGYGLKVWPTGCPFRGAALWLIRDDGPRLSDAGYLLPIAEVSLDVFVLLGIGAAIGFLSGVFGVGGGFLLTPLLIFIGVPPAVAVASSANQLVGASLSGVIAHWRRGNVDFKMGFILLLGGSSKASCR